MTWITEKEEYGASAFALFVLGLVLILFGDGLKIIGMAVNNPWALLTIVAAYFAGSGVWGLVKWYFFTSEKLHEYQDRFELWLSIEGLQNARLLDSTKDAWKKFLLDGKYPEYVRGNYSNKTLVIKPAAWEHKQRILGWMVFWPCSLIWTMLDDVVVRIVKHIQRMLSGMMDNITNIVWKGTDL